MPDIGVWWQQRLLDISQCSSGCPAQVNWEEEHQSTFVYLPKQHDIEEGAAAQQGNGSSNTDGGGWLLNGYWIVALRSTRPAHVATVLCRSASAQT